MSQDNKATIVITEVESNEDIGQYAVSMAHLDSLAQALYMAGALIGAIMEESDDPGVVLAALSHVFNAASTGYLSKRAFDPFTGVQTHKFEA